ncbi:MAG TPA: hypothetical protein VGN69_08995 [Solirubrobacteraceae bacterium]|jgi:hypothetical protein|nr:hypothetical protein [Solirubrobacteraceae bacterium]
MFTAALFHLHPHLRRHLHIRGLNLSIGRWQLILWFTIIPLTWALARFVYNRRPAHRRVALGLFAAVGVLQMAAYVSYAIWRNADVLFVLLWASLVALLAGASLLPWLRSSGRPAAGVGP